MIIQQVYKSAFIDAMRDDFSYDACLALYDYLDELSDDIGEDISFDRVAIRCEWSENTQEELEELYEMDLEEIRDHTQVVHIVSDRYLIQSF